MKHAIPLLFIVLLSNYCNAQAGYDEQYMRVPHYNGHVKTVQYKNYQTFYSFPDKPDDITTYEYDARGRMVKETNWSQRYGSEIYTYKYFGKDSFIRTLSYKGKFQRSLTTVTHYNNKGELAQEDFYVKNEQGIHPHAKVVSKYDASGFLVAQQHFETPDAQQPYSSTYYKNDSLGNHLEIFSTNANDKRTHKMIYTYRPDHEILTERELNGDSSYMSSPIQNYLYTYDDHANWIVKTEYSESTPGIISTITLRKLTYYK